MQANKNELSSGLSEGYTPEPLNSSERFNVSVALL